MNCVYKYCIVGSICFWAFALSSFAQNDTNTILLQTVTITSCRSDIFINKQQHTVFDSLTKIQYKSNTLSELLSNESGIFIKNYGPGSLSTTSFRGGNAYHTAVLWNGFNISGPTLGQNDFSLLRFNTLQNLSIVSGANSAQWGSGIISGAILLNDNFTHDNIISARVAHGSFNNYLGSLNYFNAHKKLQYYITASSQKAANNFKYFNPLEDYKISRQKNAELINYEIKSGVKYNLSNRQSLEFHAWLYHSNRNIPPTVLQHNSFSYQIDKSHRFSINYNQTYRNYICVIRSALMFDNLIFSDSLSNIFSDTRTIKNINELEISRKLKYNFRFNLLVNNTNEKAVSAIYNQGLNRISFSPVLTKSFFNDKLQNNLVLRKEFILNRQKDIPLTFSNTLQFNLLNNIYFYYSVHRFYRIPTLNDLFWVPGGNPNLMPEQGYSHEAGVKYSLNKKSFAYTFSYNIYSRRVTDWIIWLPNVSYWSPQNLMLVWSRGAETENIFAYKNKHLLLKLNVNTFYNLSTNLKKKTDDDNSINKQLIYTPMYSGFAKFTIAYKKFFIAANHTYTGYRYTSTDNTEYLKPYQLSNFFTGVTIHKNKIDYSISFNCFNLFNTNYQVMLNRPMPLRNYLINLQVQFINPKNHNL